MRCSKCSAENPEGLKFCNHCGAPFGQRCPKCGFDNACAARFCGDCGASLDSASIRGETEPHESTTGERRHLTVLFCDLVDSTRIAAQLDPEEWRETVASYQRAAAEAITRFGGHVAKYLGDGVMAFFGYPQAHDNDAERAARAGLAILDSIAKLNEQAGRPRLAARVGIHSGTVVVGAGASKEADVFGDAPNIAARVQEVAAADTIVITDDTHRLLAGLFVVQGLETPALKGVERSLQLHRVIQPSGVRGRMQAAAATRGLTPFVGREDEVRLLMSRWERAFEGEGQVALIIGEAGIGKSRLVQRFQELIAGTAHTSIEVAAAPFFQNTPFYPVVEMLKRELGSRGNESSEENLALLESRLESAGLKPLEAIPLIAPLLALPLPAKYPPSALLPEQQRRRLLATLVEWVLGAARAQPTVIATEDLHWADPSTLELIQQLVEQGAMARLLLLYTARPEFRPQWPLRAHHAHIVLNRLSSRDVRTMVQEVAARRALSDETMAAVVERTGGVPLFVEELTREVLESGGATLSGHDIPVTLHDSLMARLDRLGAAKEVFQVGAVIGVEFSYELLRAVHPIAEDDLQGSLRALADAELLYVRGIVPESSYQFKHALIRDAAYEALLKTRRKELHRQVARAIDEQFTTLSQTHPEVLARHWTEAGEAQQAIVQWSRAGKMALQRSAFSEAQESYQQALALLNLLTESAEREAHELEVRRSLVGLLSVTRGYAARETTDAVERTTALTEKTGTLAELLNWTASRCVIATISGDYPGAITLADRTLELALRDGGAWSLARAHALQLTARLLSGDLAGVEKHFTTGLPFFADPSFRQSPLRGFIVAFSSASHNACLLGRADAARERMAQMKAGVDQSSPYDLAFSGYGAGLLNLYMREYEQSASSTARAVALSDENKFPHIAGLSRCVLGAALAQLARPSEGVGLIRQGIAALFEIGARAGVGQYTAWLAEAQGCVGGFAEALEMIEQSLRGYPDEQLYRPESFRSRGELLLRQGKVELAQTSFREAIALAQKMGAKAWELRATISLARLLDDSGGRKQARAMLAEIYNWFTEGFDTADLKDANALLEQLGAS
jgi:class 3 adenylate cyclase/tetratricopeptide (TPR) repeat protein